MIARGPIPAGPNGSRLHRYAPHAVLLVVAAVLSPALAIGFVNDDFAIIRFALHGSAPDFAALLSRAEVIEVYYRPLFDLTLGLDFLAWGWSAFGYHLTNLLLHLGCTLLVGLLGRSLRLGRGASTIAALFFGLHPIHEMSIYWIAGRTDLLCTIFYLASVLLYARAFARPRERRASLMVVSLLTALGAMLAKEMAISIPATIAIVSWRLRDDIADPRARAAAGLRAAAPYALVVAGVIVGRIVLLENNLFAAGGVHGGVPIGALVRNLATYVGMLVVPVGQERIAVLLRAHPALFVIVAIVALVAGAAVVYRWRRRLGPVLFLGALLIATLVPVLRLAMRWYLYLPSAFFALALGWMFWRLIGRRRTAGLVLLGVIAVGFATIDVAAALRWIAASRIATHLGTELPAVVGPLAPGDTLLFVTVPGKNGPTPIFNLGFGGTVRHHLSSDDVVVSVAARHEMASYPTSVAIERVASDSLVLTARAGDRFFLNAVEVVAGQLDPVSGGHVATDGGPVRVLAEDGNRATAFAIALPRGRTRTFAFDGQRFVEIVR